MYPEPGPGPFKQETLRTWLLMTVVLIKLGLFFFNQKTTTLIFFLKVCTKLCKKEDLQPLDSTQELIFPPELTVCSFLLIYFSFYVNSKGMNSPSPHPQVIPSSIFNSDILTWMLKGKCKISSKTNTLFLITCFFSFCPTKNKAKVSKDLLSIIGNFTYSKC